MRNRILVGALLLLSVAFAVAAWRLRVRRDTAAIAAASELHSEWSYDPRSGLLAIADDSGEPGLALLDTKSGHVTPLPVKEPWPFRPLLSPGGRWLLYHDRNILSDDRALRHAYLMDLQTHASRVLLEAGDNEQIFNEAFSPDGTRLAYERIAEEKDGMLASDIRVVTLATAREESTGSADHLPRWSADGRHLYVTSGGCVRRVDVDVRQVATLLCVPGLVVDSGVVPSPDERWLALTVSHEGCTHVMLASMADLSTRTVDPETCAYRPLWLPGQPSRFVYLREDRASRVPALATADASAEGKTIDAGPAVYYEVAPEPGGDTILALRATPTEPRSVWRIRLGDPQGAQRLYSTVDPDLAHGHAARVEQVTVAASDGTTVPLVVFRPHEGVRARGPVLLWVHGGRDGTGEVSPRWYNEVAALTFGGLPIVAVNFRGSTGYDVTYRRRAGEKDGQSADLDAAVRYARTLAGVDPARVFWFAESAGGRVVARYLAAQGAEATPAAGLIQWTGSDLPAEAAKLPKGVPLLWVRGRWSVDAEAFPSLERGLRERGVRFETVELPRESHALYWGADRATALTAIGEFVGL